jgi:RND family efflux transporter MFP subunit
MNAIFYSGLYNAGWTLILALAAATGARRWRKHPAVGHALWLIVLLKLMTPSVVQFALPHTDFRNRDARAPSARFEAGGLAPAIRPSVELAPAVSDPVFSRDEHAPEASHHEAGTGSPKASRPRVPWRAALWEFTSKNAVPGLAFVWLIGAVVWWSVVSLNSARFRRILRSARPAPAELRERIGRVADRLGLRYLPTACLLPIRMSPIVWVPLAGSPRLVLPEKLWNRFDANQQDAILAHELAHLKRRDHWVRRLEALACGLYWWDPVAWWARREVERAEERCCDAWVLWALPGAAGAYAEALVMTADYLSGPQQPLPLGASGVGRVSPLKGRLQMILSDPTTVPIRWTAPRTLLVVGALALPFLPAPTWGGSPVAADPIAPVQVPARDQSAKAVPVPAETERQPNTASAGGDLKKNRPMQAVPWPKVRVMQPLVREVTDRAVLVGHIVAAREAELRARATGTVIEIFCRPGQVVKRGELLLKIDQRLYKAALDQAEAEVERVRARRTLVQNELAYTIPLSRDKVVSPQEVRQLEVKLLEAEASVKVAEAARDVARLNFEFTEVKAPFDGRVSGPVLGPGNVAVADTTRVATIVSTDQVVVTFNVPENIGLRFRRLKAEAFEGKGDVVLSLNDGTDYPHRGKIDSIEVGFDSATGAARWRASIPNPDGLLVPGMNVLVKLTMSAPHKATLVPEQATLNDRGEASVFVVTDQDIVERRPVKLGPVYDGFQSVEGLAADLWVVIDPVTRLSLKVQAMRVPPPAEPSPASGGKP